MYVLVDLNLTFNGKFPPKTGLFQDHIHSGEQGEQGVKLFLQYGRSDVTQLPRSKVSQN